MPSFIGNESTNEQIASISTELHLVDTLPGVLTLLDLVSQNIPVDKDTGHLTGVLDLEAARTEASGVSLLTLYENFVGSMDDGHCPPYNMLVGEQHGLFVCKVLTKMFWGASWTNTDPVLKREYFDEAVRVALRVGVIDRYFVRGMLDHIDPSDRIHLRSLEYARGILHYVTDTGELGP